MLRFSSVSLLLSLHHFDRNGMRYIYISKQVFLVQYLTILSGLLALDWRLYASLDFHIPDDCGMAVVLLRTFSYHLLSVFCLAIFAYFLIDVTSYSTVSLYILRFAIT